MSKMKETLQKEIDDLRRVRDELKVQAHLGKAEFKDAWAKLEAQWPTVEEKLKGIEDNASAFADDMVENAKGLLAELKEGYAKLRK